MLDSLKILPIIATMLLISVLLSDLFANTTGRFT